MTTGKGSRVQKTQLENILHEIRQRRNTFLLVDPTRIKVDVCYMYLKSAGINFETKVSRFMLLNQKRKYFGHVYFYRPDVITEEYKKKKTEQQIQILDLRGNVSAEFIDVGLEEPDNDKTNKEIDEIVKDLKEAIPDSKKHKMRNIFIWELHMKDNEKYSFEILAGIFELSASAVESIFYNLNKKIRNLELIKQIKLKFF